jgi:hypothetical protein
MISTALAAIQDHRIIDGHLPGELDKDLGCIELLLCIIQTIELPKILLLLFLDRAASLSGPLGIFASCFTIFFLYAACNLR